MRQNSNQGNVLFLILIALALFAALSYAVTNSTRSSGNTVGDVNVDLALSEIENYAASIQQVAIRLKTINGCSNGGISFFSERWNNGSDEGNYFNTAAPTDQRCHVFHPEGGGLPFQAPPKELQFLKDQYVINAVRINNLGTSNNEGGLWTIVTREVCIKANEKYGVENPGGEPPLSNANAGTSLTSTGSHLYMYSTGCCGKDSAIDFGGSQLGVSDRGEELKGKMSGCFQETATSDNNYILIHTFEIN